ncbi:MAG: PIG-L family deacetylase [Devosia sp.]|nr:PIG-L family deacetylase [Devosia sp.]
MKLLAIGAHPDDIEIYMFGTLASARARGDEVVMAVATDGAAGGNADPAQLRQARRREAAAAAALLGVVPHFLDFADGRLVADAALVTALRTLIVDSGADLVLTHAPNDYHADHRVLSDAVGIAAGFAAPVVWADTMMGVGFEPTHLVDITAHVETKRSAIRAHLSQDPERFVALSDRLGSFRAAQANAPAEGQAEAFRFAPIYPFMDIRDLLPPPPGVRPVGDRRHAARLPR